jgi:hypothetical protein
MFSEDVNVIDDRDENEPNIKKASRSTENFSFKTRRRKTPIPPKRPTWVKRSKQTFLYFFIVPRGQL